MVPRVVISRVEGPTVDAPIRGEWKVVRNPGDTPHALDFVGLRPGKRLPYPTRALASHLFSRLPASAAYGWDRPVTAPFDGEVTETGDGYPDTAEMSLPRDLVRNVVRVPDVDEEGVQLFAGNYVVVDGAAGTAFLAHLRRDSVTVDPGDRVTAGETLGAVGNAGASLLPHLHFQVLGEWPSTPSSLGEADLPFRFRRYDRRADGAWKPARDRRPKSGDRIRIRG